MLLVFAVVMIIAVMIAVVVVALAVVVVMITVVIVVIAFVGVPVLLVALDVPALVVILVLALALLPIFVRARRRTAGERARSEGGGPRDRHSGFRQGITVEGSTGLCDGRARENRSDEIRIRRCRGLGDPPEDVARLRAVGQDHREVGGREGAGPKGPDFEDPDRVAVALRVERHHGARRRQRRIETIDAGCDRPGAA